MRSAYAPLPDSPYDIGPEDPEPVSDAQYAAAPDLYSALEQIATGHIVGEEANHKATVHVMRAIAEEALAKARGEA